MAVSERDGLLERERELGALDSLIDAAVAGSGRVAVIEGPAGIGKTRLLAAARGRAAARGMTVLRARGSDLEREFAFGVVRQLFDSVVRREAAGRGELLVGVAAHASSVFAAPVRAGSGGGPSPAALEHGLFWLVANLAERGALLVAVDDAHWADEASLRFLHYLARRADELPIGVVMTARRAASGTGAGLVARIAAEPDATALVLHALSAAAARELLLRLVSPDAAEGLCEACYAATGGNPLLVRELAGALAENGVPAGRHELASVGRLVPHAVTRHVLVRLARRPPAAAALARAAAVLGDGAEPRHAAALAGLDETAAAEAADALAAADILTPNRRLGFVHPLLREVIYADLAPGQRATAHRRAARLLHEAGADPERTAAQLLACDPAGADWAVQTLRAAARDAQARGAVRTAATYLARALAEPPARELMPAVLTELGLAEAGTALPRASDHLTQALRLTADPIRRAGIAPELAVMLEHEGRPDEAVTVLEEAIDALADDSAELRLSLEAQAVVAGNTFLAARLTLLPRVAHARARLPALDAAAAGPLLVALAHDLSHRDGTAEQAAACAERGLADVRHMPSLWGGVVLIIAAEALARSGRLAGAEAILNELVASARARGATEIERDALTARARTLNDSGRSLEAEADVRLALELTEPEPPDFLRPYKLAELATALIDRGDTLTAAELLTPSELARHEADQTIFQPRLRDSYARLLTVQGRFQEALEQLRILERADRDWDLRNPGWTSWRPTAALIHHQLGHRERAAQLARDELDAARAFGAPRQLGIALRTAGLLAGEAGIEQLREAVAVLEHSDARLEHARALVELGAALRRAGHRSDAREPLTTALELAHERGARALADHAHHELLASGARPRRPRSSGRDALTPSELRIARMAADGLTNREIAQTLYLSVKTVEMHLGRSYRKLAIHTRHELTPALTGPTR